MAKLDEEKIEVIGEIYECNFENEGYTVVSFSVPIDTRWHTGKYKISLVDEAKP